MSRVLSYTAAIKLVERGATPLCFFLYGPEDYLKEDLIRRAEAKLVAPGLRSFNLSSFDLAETALADALAAAEAFPVMGGARMVIVRNAGRLSRSKKDRELLGARLASPPGSLAVFFLAGELDAKSGLVGTLPETVAAVLLKPLRERELDRWMASKAEAMGLTIAPAAGRLLMELTAHSMWRIANELEKLAVNAADSTEVLEDDVLALVPGAGKLSPFTLADAIRSGDRRAAAGAVTSLLARGEAPVRLTALITGQVIRSWRASSAAPGRDDGPSEEFRRRALVLCETDSSLKRSKISPHLATQLMADALTRKRR